MTEDKPRTGQPVDETDAAVPEAAATENDARILAAPLALYGLVAFAMVAVIVITAIKLNDELNMLDEQYASIEPAVASRPVSSHETRIDDTVAASAPVSVAGPSRIEAVAVAVPVPATPAAVTAQPARSTLTATQQQTADSPAPKVAAMPEPLAVAPAPVAGGPDPVAVAPEAAAATEQPEATVAATEPADTEPVSTEDGFRRMLREEFEEYLAERQAYDEERLERYKAMLDKRVARMNERITRTQQLIDETRLRNAERYAAREAAIQERQARRAERLSRI